eukprot:9389887-Alexandrium_andersonii.AAC.1
MSASLVGSEMCIRDRASRDLRRATVGRRRGDRPGGRNRALEPGEGPLDPVSYTHLTLPTICSV